MKPFMMTKLLLTMGVNKRAIQVSAFTIGGSIAGLSGGLYALYFGFIEAQYFNANISILFFYTS